MTDTNDTDELFDPGDELSANGARALQAGNVKEGHEWFRQAIDAYRAALTVAPEDDVLLVANLRLCIGARLAGVGDGNAALALYEEVLGSLEAHPELTDEGEGADILAQARLNRAESRLTSGAVSAAKEEIEAVLQAFPDHPYAVYLLERASSSPESPPPA